MKILEKISYHRTLARYFSRKSLYLERDDKKVPNIRKLVELPWQQIQGKMREEVTETLSDLIFIEAKCINKLFYDLLLDFAHCNSILGIPELGFVRQAVTSSQSGLFIEPDHYLSMLWNRLRWLLPADNIPEVLQTNLGKAHRKLMNSPAWLHAIAPLPETKQIKPNEFPLDAIVIQALNMSSKKMSITDGFSTIDILDIKTGASIINKPVNDQNILGITLAIKDNRIATIDKSGFIYFDYVKTKYQTRKNEQLIEWVSDYLIFVRNDDCLVAWETVRDEVHVLLKDIPKPLIILRSDTERTGVIVAAGYRKQVFGYIITDPNISFFELSVPNSAPILSGDINIQKSLASVATADSTVYLIDILKNDIVKKCSYTYETSSRLRGMAKKIAFGSGPTENTIFIATDSGQVWNWNYTINQFKSYSSFKGHKEGSSLICLGVWSDTGLPFVSTENHAQTLVETDQDSNLAQPVTGICLTDKKRIVAINYDGHSVSIYSAEGLKKENQLQLNWPTSVDYCHKSDSVWVGSKTGLICKISTKRTNELVAANSVIGIFDSTSSAMIWIAQENGDILCIPTIGADIREAKKMTKVLWNSIGYEKRYKVIPASDNGTFWSMSRKETDQNINISLINAKQNALILDEKLDLTDIAVSRSYSLFATSGNSIKIYQITNEKWKLLYIRNTPTKYISFLGNGKFLLAAYENWFHVHKVMQGLPVIAAHDLTSRINCIASNNMNIVVGLQSGEIVSFRLENNIQ